LVQAVDVERTLRTAKSLFSPHARSFNLDETIRSHIPCSFFVLVLSALKDCISNLGKSGSWPEILANLGQLTETDVM
jgi:hypothetical protein